MKNAYGLDLKKSAIYTMLPPAMMVVGSIIGGFAADRITRNRSAKAGRCSFSAVTLVLTAVLLAAGSQIADPMLAVGVLALGAGALYLSQSAYWALAADFGGPHAGVVSGLVNMSGMLAGTLTASATPWLGEHYGWSSAFLVGAGFALAGAVAWLMVNASARLHHEDQVQVEG